MNRHFYLLLAGLFSLPSLARADRQTLPLMNDWKFVREDAGVEAASEHWQSVNLPHTWNALDGQAGRGRGKSVTEPATAPSTAPTTEPAARKSSYYRGRCWYERSLDIPADWKGKRIFVRFEAASLVADVYLNGKHLGQHRGGFTAFCYELTPSLEFGKANELRVAVDNSHFEDVPPLSGDFNVDGGLYRPVQLIVTDSLCITPLDFASSGIYVTTKSLADESATLEVRAMVSKATAALVNATVQAEVLDAGGQSVATLRTDGPIAAGDPQAVTQQITFAHPHRWNGQDDPYLYSVRVRILQGGHSIDEITQQIGLRTVEISQRQGFLLNGKPYPIHGVNRHQDKRDKGWALTPADEQADVQVMLDMGVTAIRMAHYPQSQSIHSMCDRAGLLCWDEVSLVNETRDTQAFWDNAGQQLRELTHQLYNHPSVAFWGLYNELENNKTPPSGPQLTELRKIAEGIDPGRIVVAASDHNNRYFNKIPAAPAFNQYPGWYGKPEVTAMAGFIDARAKEIGGRIALSEYGAGGNPTQHAEGTFARPTAGGESHPEEYQDYIHEHEWAQIRNNPNVWGSFLWVMFDFASSGRHEGGTVALNDKGMITQDRATKKDVYYFYQANWTKTPMVYIASRRATQRTQAGTEIKVYSNCEAVELKLNGKSLGTMKPDDVKICRWPDVKLTAGVNRIEVSAAAADGKQLSDSCEWTLTPSVQN